MTLRTEIDNTKAFMLSHRNVPQVLKHWAELQPEKRFLAWEPFAGEPRHWTYKQFADDVEATAASLHHRGVGFGDKVMIHMDNSPEFLLSWFACVRIGAVAVSTNTRSVARDMSYFAEHAEIVAAITQPKFAQLVADAAPNIKFLAVTDNNAGEPASTDVEHVAFAELTGEERSCPEVEVGPMDDLGIQFTSGTTSRPKAVLWTHANAIWAAQLNAQHFRLRDNAVCLTVLPLFHTNAQSYSMLSTLWVGGTLVLQPKFSASRFWDVSLRNQCNWASMIPFCVKALTEQPLPEKHDYELWVTAVRLTMAEQYFKVKTLGLWGMTETITHGIVADFNHLGPDMGIGRPSTGYDIAVLNDNDKTIKAGERGRLFIRGTRGVTLFKEYYKNEKATNESFDENGWFDTGDMVRMDDCTPSAPVGQISLIA